MLPQTEGKIFLASQRSHFENDGVRSYHTINVDTSQRTHEIPFGALTVLNDDTLASGRSLTQFVKDDSDVILLPTVGTIRYTDSTGNETLVEASQVQQHTTAKGTTFEVCNPYENELINFIQIWMKRSVAETFSKPHVHSFNSIQNKLIQITPDTVAPNTHAPKLFLGKFAGREEISHVVSNSQNGAFIFVLQGAFEVQYRLLETRDGLALWVADMIELEALSNDAIILLIEVPLL